MIRMKIDGECVAFFKGDIQLGTWSKAVLHRLCGGLPAQFTLSYDYEPEKKWVCTALIVKAGNYYYIMRDTVYISLCAIGFEETFPELKLEKGQARGIMLYACDSES